MSPVQLGGIPFSPTEAVTVLEDWYHWAVAIATATYQEIKIRVCPYNGIDVAPRSHTNVYWISSNKFIERLQLRHKNM